MRRRKKRPPEAMSPETVEAVGGLYASDVPEEPERRRAASSLLTEARAAMLNLKDSWEEFEFSLAKARQMSQWAWNSDGALMSFEDACAIVHRDPDALREKLYEGLSKEAVRVVMGGRCPYCGNVPCES